MNLSINTSQRCGVFQGHPFFHLKWWKDQREARFDWPEYRPVVLPHVTPQQDVNRRTKVQHRLQLGVSSWIGEWECVTPSIVGWWGLGRGWKNNVGRRGLLLLLLGKLFWLLLMLLSLLTQMIVRGVVGPATRHLWILMT